MSRIWPESTRLLDLVDRLQPLLLGRLGGVDPVGLHHQRHRVAQLGEESTLPLYLGSKRSLIEVMSGARSVRTISPVIPLCHGHGELAARGRTRGPRRLGSRFSVDVRDRLLVELLDVAEVVVRLRHPVGGDDDVAAARLAVLEVGAQLGEEGLVRVDVLEVLRCRRRSRPRTRRSSRPRRRRRPCPCRCRADRWTSSARPRPGRPRRPGRRCPRPRRCRGRCRRRPAPAPLRRFPPPRSAGSRSRGPSGALHRPFRVPPCVRRRRRCGRPAMGTPRHAASSNT